MPIASRHNGFTRFESLVNVCIVIATTLAVVLFVKREGYFQALISKEPPSRNQLSVAPALQWSRMTSSGNRDGLAGAPIQIVEFADFECPVCRRFESVLRSVKKRYGDSLSITFVHYPLSYHRFAISASRAAECAAVQGRFTQMHDVLFEQQDSLGIKPYIEFAREAGVADAGAFTSCVARRDTVQRIKDGLALGDDLHILGTPTVVVNGWYVSALPTIADLDTIINRSLRGTLRTGNVSTSAVASAR